MKRILVTGSCGYIGSHTIVELIEHGYDVVGLDSLERGMRFVPDRVKLITGKVFHNQVANLCNGKLLRQFFDAHHGFDGVIHFAAFKMVGESVKRPLRYYTNNLNALSTLLICMHEFKTSNLIFSSSSSVYGNSGSQPVNENTPTTQQESPYARTKIIGEQMITDFSASNPLHAYMLRYFNPAGNHPSALIGEPIEEHPQNIVPAITRTAAGKQEVFTINGTDYPTRDGSCIRDYVHVMDIARAHVLALEKLLEKKNPENFLDVINLGSGNGVSVKEMIAAFEKVTGKTLPVIEGPRRPGDAVALFSDISKARAELNWSPEYSLEQMMADAWKWELANQ